MTFCVACGFGLGIRPLLPFGRFSSFQSRDACARRVGQLLRDCLVVCDCLANRAVLARCFSVPAIGPAPLLLLPFALTLKLGTILPAKLMAAFHPLRSLAVARHNYFMRSIFPWLLLAISAAALCFAVRLGVPFAFGSRMT